MLNSTQYCTEVRVAISKQIKALNIISKYLILYHRKYTVFDKIKISFRYNKRKERVRISNEII